jgi:hypothetical protein
LVFAHIVIFIIVLAVKAQSDIDFKLKWICQYVAVFLCSLFLGYFRKLQDLKSSIKFYNNSNTEKQKNSQINDFINRLLPQHVQEILNNPNSKLSDLYENVTIVFADICGFTAYSANRQPKDVVTMLSKLFTDFDKECDALRLFKVYTIGDCYVALGFLDKKNREKPHEEAFSMIDFAFKMVDIVARVRKEINFDELAMRIGIHTVS